MQTRDEHLAFCKERALEYLERLDYLNAVTSMLSDLEKHPDTAHVHNDIAYLGILLARDKDYTGLVDWIKGFR